MVVGVYIKFKNSSVAFRLMTAQKQKIAKATDNTDSRKRTIKNAKGRFEIEQEFIKEIDAMVKESLKTRQPMARTSETDHWIHYNGEVLVAIKGGSKIIETMRPYCLLPEPIKRLVDHGEKLGYMLQEGD